MSGPLRALFVEDVEDDTRLLLQELLRGGWDVSYRRVETAADMTAALRAQAWDIIIADYAMPTFTGLEALILARRIANDVPFILVSGTVGEEVAVEALKAGANDYLFKGNFKRLVPAVSRELREAHVRREARRIEKELRKREGQLIDAYRLAHLGSWHVDFRANSVTCSDEALRILACEAAAGASLTFEQFLACLHGDDRALLTDSLQNPHTTQLARDFRTAGTGGAVRFVHMRGDIIRDGAANALEATGMIQDITERKLAEQALRQANDDLALASKSKDRFLAILSHELRTPLTPVLAIVSHLEAQVDLSPEMRADLGTIRQNVQMEARLIDDLLDLTRIVRNKLELHFEVVDAHALLGRALEVFSDDVAGKSLTVTANLSATRRHVWADPIRLRQVFLNLLSNAVKFTPTGGTILISSSDVAGRLRIEVRDNGIGIESEVLPRLFQMFEQGERTITRRYGGLGLGLSIAKSLLDLHGGTVAVDSPGPGKGTIFTLELTGVPAIANEARPAVDPPAPAAAPAVEGRAYRVLLVEDHDDTRRIMARLLKSAGYSVSLAASVKEALEVAEKEPFDLLLSDIGLPDGSGTDIMRHFKANSRIKGIALSGFGQEDDLRKSREAGFDLHLTKPVDFRILQEVIRKMAG